MVSRSRPALRSPALAPPTRASRSRGPALKANLSTPSTTRSSQRQRRSPNAVSGACGLILTERQRSFLSSQTYAANVHVCFRVPRLNPPASFNAIFPCGRDRAPLAALAFHRKKALGDPKTKSELVSVYLSDPESLRVMDDDDEALSERCLQLAREVFPALPKEAELFHISRRREAIPVHRVGRYREAVAFHEAQAQSKQSVTFCGDYATATIDGAIETGLRAANLLLKA